MPSYLIDDGAPGLVADLKSSDISSNGASEPRLSKKDKKDLKVTFAEVAKKELRNVNKDYFGSYSAFGIHREMLSDKFVCSTGRSFKVIAVDGSSKLAAVATQTFDLARTKADDTNFTAQFKLELLPSSGESQVSDSSRVSSRLSGLIPVSQSGFCKEKPVLLTTSPYSP